MVASDRKIISSKCRDLLKTHSDLLEYIAAEIEKESNQPINGDTSFLVAKAYLRQEGIREGVKLLLRKISNYADVKE